MDEFLIEFQKLKKRKSYRNIEKEVIDYFIGKELDKLLSGTRLNNNNEVPYIKKRLAGSGGFRFYFLLIIIDKKLYLMFVHPKTGPFGAENIDDKSKAKLYKKVYEDIQSNNLHQLEVKNGKLEFKKGF